MPSEIFIAEEPAPEPDKTYLAEKQAAEMGAIAEYGEWLQKQTETVQALASEWGTRRGSHFTLSERRDKFGRTVYICQSEHGYHESLQSHDHATFLLVDSHRVREEDKPETVARIQKWGGSYRDAKLARQTAQAAAKRIREANPGLSGEERDALLLADLSATEARDAAEAAKQRADAVREAGAK